jgi:hypothetical protein
MGVGASDIFFFLARLPSAASAQAGLEPWSRTLSHNSTSRCRGNSKTWQRPRGTVIVTCVEANSMCRRSGDLF